MKRFIPRRLIQMRGPFKLLAIAVVLLSISLHMFWTGYAHRGPGYWTFGDEDHESFTELITESQYRRQCYCVWFFTGLIGLGMLRWACEDWETKHEAEEIVSRIILEPHHVQGMRERPWTYREEVLEWAKDNHPAAFRVPSASASARSSTPPAA